MLGKFVETALQATMVLNDPLFELLIAISDLTITSIDVGRYRRQESDKDRRENTKDGAENRGEHRSSITPRSVAPQGYQGEVLVLPAT